MTEHDGTGAADEPTGPGASRPAERRLALVVGWVAVVAGAGYLALNPASLGPAFSLGTTLAIAGLLAGLGLVAWGRGGRFTD